MIRNSSSFKSCNIAHGLCPLVRSEADHEAAKSAENESKAGNGITIEKKNPKK